MKKLLYFVAFVGLLHFGAGTDLGDPENRDETGCPKIFRGKCECKRTQTRLWMPQRNNTFVVNCTNKGFTSTSMLKYLPNETEVLIFTGNNIPFLENNVLGMTQEHEVLKVIDMSYNNIREITGKAFHKVRNVEILMLNHNDLRISGEENHSRMLTNFYNLKELHLTNAFTEMVDSKYYLNDLAHILQTAKGEGVDQLWKLHLEQNEIWDGEGSERLFCSGVLPELSDLYLGDNQLQDINFDFACIKKLHFLDLSRNKIKRLDKLTLNRIDNVFHMPHNKNDSIRKIDLTGNPFVCDCYLRDLYDWLTETSTNLYRRDQMRCFTGNPIQNAGKRIVNIQELMCDTQTNRYHNMNYHHSSSVGSGVTHTLLVILIILVLCLLVALLWINKERVHSNVKPLIDNFQRSLQYRTIEKDLAESQITPEVNV